MTNNGSVELYKRYRPTKLSQLVGQDAAVQTLSTMGRQDKFPHALLLSGPSGCGKTTVARILADRLKCYGEDFHEVNAGEARGIDEIRSIQQAMAFRPMFGESSIWLMDEAHQLTSAAANAFLKPLEDTPSYVYFMLATTEPQKIIRTIRTRCTEIKLNSIGWQELERLIIDVSNEEGRGVVADVVDKIVKLSDGSAREALVKLHQVIGLDSEEKQLAALEEGDHEQQGIDLARALMGRDSWKSVAGILKNIKDDPEKVRHVVLGYARTALLGGNAKAYDVIDSFRENFYDSKQAGLAAACWEVKHVAS